MMVRELRELVEGEEACAKCGEPTSIDCELCKRPFCTDCCAEYEGIGFCDACYPFGAVADWGDEEHEGIGDVKDGTCLHLRSCPVLKSLRKMTIHGGDYLYVFMSVSDGAEALRSGRLNRCGVCGADPVEFVEGGGDGQ